MGEVCALCGKEFPNATRYYTKDNYKICKECAGKLGLGAFSTGKYKLAEMAKNPTIDEISNTARIQIQLSELGFLDTFGTKKEIKSLPEFIGPDEDIRYLTSGLYDGNTILLVLTNRRMLFLDKGMVYGLNKTEVPINKINSVSYKKGLLLSSLKMFNGAAPIEISNIDNKTIEKLAAAINEEVHSINSATNQTIINQNNFSAADEIKKYKLLLDEDIITQEEFDKKKKELLNL